MPPAGRLSAPAIVLEEGSNEANIKAVEDAVRYYSSAVCVMLH